MAYRAVAVLLIIYFTKSVRRLARKSLMLDFRLHVLAVSRCDISESCWGSPEHIVARHVPASLGSVLNLLTIVLRYAHLCHVVSGYALDEGPLSSCTHAFKIIYNLLNDFGSD